MDDAVLVRGFECVGNLPRDRQRLVERDRPSRDPVGERLALDEFEDQGAHAVRVLHPVDRCDVRMVQRGEDVRFALKARQPLRVRANSSGRIFDGDVALRDFVSRARYTSPIPPAPSRPRTSYAPTRLTRSQGHVCGADYTWERTFVR